MKYVFEILIILLQVCRYMRGCWVCLPRRDLGTIKLYAYDPRDPIIINNLIYLIITDARHN